MTYSQYSIVSEVWRFGQQWNQSQMDQTAEHSRNEWSGPNYSDMKLPKSFLFYDTKPALKGINSKRAGKMMHRWRTYRSSSRRASGWGKLTRRGMLKPGLGYQLGLEACKQSQGTEVWNNPLQIKIAASLDKKMWHSCVSDSLRSAELSFRNRLRHWK